ncbi:hypothetical protein HPB50_025241 [Hyalomma asiaticum]|uniref:Uncharacterized protein n=1 Tax=Hyalomma asiaticum TaxID=266040 RepID=A0ACB7SN34_HYAAI|nr:hypothetical protein HPB50_025241 [Hyalomma asiaticum]
MTSTGYKNIYKRLPFCWTPTLLHAACSALQLSRLFFRSPVYRHLTFCFRPGPSRQLKVFEFLGFTSHRPWI